MERLTRVSNVRMNADDDTFVVMAGDVNKAFNKLGRLERIEQELGIPLEVLFKALKEGIYHIRYDSIFVDLTVTLKGNIVFQDSDNNLISLKDYGKAWALTREELEDESSK